MSVRVYILLDIIGGKSEHAVQILRSRAGVVIADPLEGRPDVIVTVEAPDRQRLAESIMPVITCVEGITEDLQLLVTREALDTHITTDSGIKKTTTKKTRKNSRVRANSKL